MLAVAAAAVAALGIFVVAGLLVWNYARWRGEEEEKEEKEEREERRDDNDRHDRDDRLERRDDDRDGGRDGHRDGNRDGGRDGTAVNVPTRGGPDAYTQIGTLSTTNAAQGASQKNNVLPLFGRQTYRRSSRFNYYTQLESGVRVPLSMDGKPCEASLGCPEVYEGDKVVIDELKATYEVNLYEEAPIRYIPRV